MKIKMFLILTFIFSSGIYAADAEICAGIGVPEIAGESVNEILAANEPVKKYSETQITNAARAACNYLADSLTLGFSSSKFKEKIANQIGLNPNDKDINSLLSDFLNQNKDKMICAKDPKSNTSRSMHFYKYAILNGIIDLYDEILFDDEEFEIDFNAVEMVDGKPETLVDYIDKRIASGTGIANTLKGIRIDVVDLGGKKGADL